MVKSSLRALGFYTDWQLAGIPGGIPDTAEVFETVAPDGDINSAIQRAGDAVSASGGAILDNLLVIQLTEGIYDVEPVFLNRSGVILRGCGTKTILRGNTVNTGAIEIGEPGRNIYVDSAIDVIGDVYIGDDHITVFDASRFDEGMILKIDRLADDALVTLGGLEWVNGHNQFMRDDHNSIYGPASKNGLRPVSQYIEIKRKEGNKLYLSNRININFCQTGASGKNLKPQVWDTGAHLYQYIGLENMKLQMTAGNDERGPWTWHSPAVVFKLASSYCWIKNIESDGTFFNRQNRGFMGRHVEMFGFRCHVTGGYFHHSSQISPGGNGYGIRWHGTDCIIDNNICDFLNKPMLGQTTNGGNVIAYNYVPNAPIAVWKGNDYIDAATPGKPQVVDTWIETAIDPSHGGFSHSDLFEGNYAANIHTDPTSNNSLLVLFRNHSFGINKGGYGPDGAYFPLEYWTNGSRNAVAIDGPQNEHASIGNVYLTPETSINAVVWDNHEQPVSGGIAVYRFGGGNDGQYNYKKDENGGHKDGGRKYAFDRFFWAYDYNYVENDLSSRASDGDWEIPTAPLPDSLYLEKAPSYFNGYSWPPVDPFASSGKTRTGILPAEDRYLYNIADFS